MFDRIKKIQILLLSFFVVLSLTAGSSSA